MKTRKQILKRKRELKKELEQVTKDLDDKKIKRELMKRIGLMVRYTQLPCEINQLEWVLVKQNKLWDNFDKLNENVDKESLQIKKPKNTKEMIDYLLTEKQITVEQHGAIQLCLAGEFIKAKGNCICIESDGEEIGWYWYQKRLCNNCHKPLDNNSHKHKQ